MNVDRPSIDRSVGPVFVGGTGRSGTTVTARLIGAHSEAAVIPIEMRFHVDPGGLPDLIRGATDLSSFLRRLRGPWFERTFRDGSKRGLHLVVDRGEFELAVASFEETAGSDLLRAGRELLTALARAAVGPVRCWVEMTPPNVLEASALLQLVPDARFVNVYRDGRDVACSVAPLGWGPNDPVEAVDWWADLMVRAHRELSRIPSYRVLHLRMEDLVLHRREESLRRLSHFLGLEVDRSLEDYFDHRVDAERAHIGRWRSQPDDVRRALEERYEEVRSRLVDAGVPGATDL